MLALTLSSFENVLVSVGQSRLQHYNFLPAPPINFGPTPPTVNSTIQGKKKHHPHCDWYRHSGDHRECVKPPTFSKQT